MNSQYISVIRKAASFLILLLIAHAGFARGHGDKKLNNVVVSYLRLKNAFMAENRDSISEAARKMLYVMDKMPVEELTAAKQKEWMNYAEKLKDDAMQIKAAADVEQQKGFFVTLSANLYKMLKELK